MPTNDRAIRIYIKRLLSKTAIETNWMQFLKDEINEVTASIFQGRSGVLDGDEIELTSSANDTFDLDLTNAHRVIVQDGHIIDLSQITGTGITSAIPFENATGVTYSVGIKFAEVEDGIEANPRTGDPEYPLLKQTYGEVDYPDSVADNTTYIRLIINSITGSSEDHSGRTCRVWLVNPQSLVEGPSATAAYFEGTVGYSSPNNYVDIPYSGAAGPLGQDTGSGPPSTTATDYKVFIEGATWRNKANKDLSADADYAFIGEITGNGPGATPVAFDISNQVPIFLISMDSAYDGPMGSGSGRQAFVDAEAIEFITRTGNTDELKATLRLDRKGDTGNGGVGLQTISDERDGYTANQAHLLPLTHTTSGLAIDNPASSTNPDIVTRTGAVDWSTSGLNMRMDLAWLQGFSTIDGLYTILAVTPTTLQLRGLDGSIPAFPNGETGNITILRVLQMTSPTRWGALTNPIAHGMGGTSFHGINESSGPLTNNGGDDDFSAVTLYGDNSDNLRVLESYVSNPLFVTWINKEGEFKTLQPLLIAPARETQLQSSGAGGLQLTAAGVNGLLPLDWFVGGGDYLASVQDPTGQIVSFIEPGGYESKPHVFKDDFFYEENATTGWSSNATAPRHYEVSSSGGASVKAEGASGTPQMAHGGAAVFSLPALASSVALRGPHGHLLDTNKALVLFKGRLACDDTILGDKILRLGLYGGVLTAYGIYFEMDANTHANGNYWLVINDSVNPTEKVDTGFGPQFATGNPRYSNFYFAVTGAQTIRYYTSEMAAPATKTLSLISFAGAGDLLRLYCYYENIDPSATKAWLDYWEARDNEVIADALGQQWY